MMTFQQFMATYRDENDCRQFLMDRRWPDGKVLCPRCGRPENVYKIALPWKWECSNIGCRSGNAYRFSVTAGTIFENTKHPLMTWFKVLYTMLQSKKGVSSRQIRRMFFGEQSSTRTAWYMCHRLRAGMADPDFKQLMGIVEVDETFMGGARSLWSFPLCSRRALEYFDCTEHGDNVCRLGLDRDRGGEKAGDAHIARSP